MSIKFQKYGSWKRWLKAIFGFAITATCFYTMYAFAETKDIGAAAEKLTGSFSNLGKLLVGAAYLSGFGFVVAGIFKFKQAKDSHGQMPFSTPIAIVLVGACLLFLPSLVQIVSQSIFEKPIYGGFEGAGAAKVEGGGT